MSSILDALKKLEAEKARQAEAELVRLDDEPFEPDTAGEELVVPLIEAPGPPVAVSTRTLVVGGAVFAVALVAISVSISLWVARSSVTPIRVTENVAAPVAESPVLADPSPANEAPSATPPPEAPAAASPPAPEADLPAATPKPEPPAKPVVAKTAKPTPAPVKAPKPVSPPPETQVAAPEPAPAPEAPPAAQELAPAPKAVQLAQAPKPVMPPEPALVEQAPAPVAEEPALVIETPVAAPPPLAVPPPPSEAEIGPVDLKKLPILRSSERVRFGLENVRLNVLREASPTRPHGLAIINLNKVYIGETIPGTRARLIEVKSHGIGIEIMDSGERFYFPH
jgi:hypothetical protein